MLRLPRHERISTRPDLIWRRRSFVFPLVLMVTGLLCSFSSLLIEPRRMHQISNLDGLISWPGRIRHD